MDQASSGYFDESRVDGSFPFPIVAGFWNPIELWGFCEREINRALLQKPPNVKAKKYVQANAFEFSRIIAQTVIYPIFATIEYSAFEPYFHQGKNTNDLFFSDAYTACSYAACELLDAIAERKKWQAPVETVFDDGSSYKIQFERAYRKYYATKPQSRLSKTVAFRDDEQTPVLLAAHLYAWLLSGKYNYVLTPEEVEALHTLEQQQPAYVELTATKIEDILQRITPKTS